MKLVVKNQTINNGKARRISLLVLLLYVVVYFAAYVLSSVQGTAFATVIETCMGREATNIKLGFFTKGLRQLIAFSAMGLTVFFDILILFKTKKSVVPIADEDGQPTLSHVVPVKATILSATLYLMYMGAVISMSILTGSKLAAVKVSVVMFAALLALRCTATTMLTYVHKDRTDKEEDKATRQEKERGYAKKAREDRENGNISPNLDSITGRNNL